jgi:diguanylate cyclase
MNKRDIVSLKVRLADDFRFSLVLLVAMVTVLAVTPFAVYRLLTGYLWVALVDFALVAVALLSAVYAVRTGRTRGPALVLSILITGALIVVTRLLGLQGALWLFPVIIFVFYLAPPLLALALTTAALGYFVFQSWMSPGSIFESTEQMAAVLATGIASGVFSYFFALRANRQHDRLMRWATRDPLTGLYNRRSLEDELKIAIALRDRRQISYGLVILDLDNFKEVNDQAGHGAGDVILKKLARLITTHTRVDDRAFRYGGDEFIVLCSNIDARGLQTFAENLVTIIGESLRWDHTTVTASVGASLLRNDDTAETWNIRVDRHLYTAKERGRNRAVVDE